MNMSVQEPVISTDVLIIGSGFAGIAVAHQLQQSGINEFVILEKSDSLGGTWRDNHYPGCACDVPSHLYSFSFRPNPKWSRQFAPQKEILGYLKDTARHFKIDQSIHYKRELKSAIFDVKSSSWRVECTNGRLYICRFLCTAIGALHVPEIPKIKGIERFKGEAFHSSNWNHDLDLSEKRVAVVGTGASAIQFVPEIAEKTKSLSVFQRTAPWILPKPDRKISKLEQQLYRKLPITQRAARASIYWRMEARALAFTRAPKALRLLEPLAKRSIAGKVNNSATADLVTPNFTLGCKRILMSNRWYQSLNKKNVHIVASGAASAGEGCLIDESGTAHPADVVIYGTGFKTIDAVAEMDIRGADGITLGEYWEEGAPAYKGTQVAGFPNMFIATGPNTGLGHSSMIYMIESQARYIAAFIKEADQRNLQWVDVKVRAQTDWVYGLQRRMSGTVWASGCKSWYLDAKGNNWTLWPDFTFVYRRLLNKVEMADFNAAPREDPLTSHQQTSHQTQLA